MKKIIIAVLIGIIPTIFILGGIHYFTFVKKQYAIEKLMMSVDSAYYKGIASVCYKKNFMEYACCIDSVQKMIDLNAPVAQNGTCDNMVMDSLDCAGSYQWCVPIQK